MYRFWKYLHPYVFHYSEEFCLLNLSYRRSIQQAYYANAAEIKFVNVSKASLFYQYKSTTYSQHSSTPTLNCTIFSVPVIFRVHFCATKHLKSVLQSVSYSSLLFYPCVFALTGLCWSAQRKFTLKSTWSRFISTDQLIFTVWNAK